MKIIDPGHHYSLDRLDFDNTEDPVLLRFVKRIGDKYPGNELPGYDGTTTQEVLRALIDRTMYVDNQIHDDANDHVLHHLRSALTHLESRAAIRRGDHHASVRITLAEHDKDIEDWPVCEKCGHVMCEEHKA